MYPSVGFNFAAAWKIYPPSLLLVDNVNSEPLLPTHDESCQDTISCHNIELEEWFRWLSFLYQHLFYLLTHAIAYKDNRN